MITAEKMEAVGEQVLGCVGKDVRTAALNDRGLYEVGEEAIPGNFAQAYDDAETGERGDLGGEVGGAVADLLGERLVSWRGTADDRGDPSVAEAEAIVAGDGAGLGGKTEGMQGRGT